MKKIRVQEPFDVLKVKNGKVCLGGEPLKTGELENLKAEIKLFRSFRLRSIFYETLRQYAIDKVMTGTAINDKDEELLNLMVGKAMLHNLGILERLEETIDSL